MEVASGLRISGMHVVWDQFIATQGGEGGGGYGVYHVSKRDITQGYYKTPRNSKMGVRCNTVYECYIDL